MRRITIRFSKAGIYQFHTFIEKDGIIENQPLFVKYAKDYPDLSSAKTIEEIVEIVKEYSYGKKCEIWMIDSLFQGIQKDDITLIEELTKKIDDVKEDFYKTVIKPVFEKYKTNFSKEYENDIPEDEFRRINQLSYKFLNKIGVVKYYDFTNENNFIEDFVYWFNSYEN